MTPMLQDQVPSRKNSCHPNASGLAEWFRRRAKRSAKRTALIFEDERWTYGDMQSRVEHLSAVLVAGGTGPGDRVAFLGFNHPLLLITLFACARIGAVFVPLNFRLTSSELSFMINDAGVHSLIVDEEHLAVIDSARADIDCNRYLCLGAVQTGWESLAAALSQALPPPPQIDARPDDIAGILYTSGTTGRPKGAILTHANFWANNLNWLMAVEFAAEDVVLNCAPLFHVGGLCVTVLPTLMAGGCVVLQRAFVPEQFVDAIERHHASVAFAVPAMLLAVTALPAFAKANLSSLRLIIAGGAPVPEPQLKLFNGLGIPMSQGWGMTESASAVTFLDPSQSIEKLGSCGQATLLSDFRLIDAEAQPISEANVKGEICMRGDNVSPGYWKNPNATAEALDADGWFRSGDIGYLDADACLYVCDRLKDMIISGGENIYPAEIESILYAHESIAEVAVVGAPDTRWGERAVAFVALRPGATLTLTQMQTFAEARLARYKLPRELRFVDSLPRNSNGKVLKNELRERCQRDS